MGGVLAKKCLAMDACMHVRPSLHYQSAPHARSHFSYYSQDQPTGNTDFLPPKGAPKSHDMKSQKGLDLYGASSTGTGNTKSNRETSSSHEGTVIRKRKSTTHSWPTRSRSESGTMSEDSFFDNQMEEENPLEQNVIVFKMPSPSSLHVEFAKKYVLEELLGTGTTAKCYKCKRRSDGRIFACKIVDKRRLGYDPRRRQMMISQFRQEIQVLKRLNHPNIAKLEDAFENDTHILLVMELLQGGELFESIIERGHFTELEAKQVAACVLSAIQYMHNKGIVHRDMKPENLLLVSKSHHHESQLEHLQVKIIDFGFSKLLGESTTSSFLGTGGYLAPEILLHHKYTSSVDMWAFGVILYLLLCGRLPFKTSTYLQPGQKVSTLYKLIFPDKYWKDISEEAKDLVRKILVIDPKKRINAETALSHPWLQEVLPVP